MITLSLACDLTLKDWEYLELGEIANIIIDKGNLINESLGQDTSDNDKPTIRKATQADWDRLGG